MTAVIDAEHKVIDCPHCKGKLNVEIERKPATVTLTNSPAFAPEDVEKLVEKVVERKMPKETPKAETPKEPEVPSYLPKHFCKGKGCDGHENPNRKKVTKKCNNCDQVSPENAGKCPWCGENDFDDLDEDEIDKYNGGMEHVHE